MALGIAFRLVRGYIGVRLSGLGLYRDNGRENGNYYNVGIQGYIAWNEANEVLCKSA